MFDQIKGELAPDSPDVRVLCPTRWTVLGVSMKRVIQKYSILQELWEKAADVVKDIESKACIQGFANHLSNFNLFFALVLGEMLLSHCDNFSSILQSPHLSAAEGSFGRRSGEWLLSWMLMKLSSQKRGKVPMRYESGTAPPKYLSTPKSHYCQIFYEALDLIVHVSDDRFDQPGY